MKLSVVIAVRSGEEPVLNCLATLETLIERASMELIIANSCAESLSRRVQILHPGVIAVSTPAEWSIAQVREAGIRQASGEIIAVVHERYTVSGNWAEGILEAHCADCDVVGGCVAPGPALSLTGWAIYLSEYTHIAPPMSSGPLGFDEAIMLPGGNVSYKRRVFALT